MTDPTSFTKLDADRILRRAAEIDGSEDARRLSVEELRAIAGEAGFAAQAVERAITEAQEAALASRGHAPVQSWGFVVTHVSCVREIPVQIDSAKLLRVVRLFQPYREGPAQVRLEEREIAWRDRKGLRFSVISAGGTTEVRVYVSKVLLRRGRWMSWVRAAADRLESLVLLVSGREGSVGGTAATALPGPEVSGGGGARG